VRKNRKTAGINNIANRLFIHIKTALAGRAAQNVAPLCGYITGKSRTLQRFSY
jgi:hypothetical protein